MKKGLLRLSLTALLLGNAATALAQSAPIVLPGAPGQASRVISAQEAIRLANTGHSPADTAFMQNMLVHHQQAVDMAALVKSRTNNPNIVAMAGRIDASQADEMKFMRTWLGGRGEPLSMPGMEHMHHLMKGMASADQMAQLANSRGDCIRSDVSRADDSPPQGCARHGGGPAQAAGHGL
jgi:uncharacterized protein (DUF305 family)